MMEWSEESRQVSHILTERNRFKAAIGRQSAIKLLHKTATTHFEPIKTTQNTHFLWLP